MALVIIDPNLKWGQIRTALNQNTQEIASRLGGIEVLNYVRSGNGPPVQSSFNEGDYYIDDNSHHLYKKTNGVWVFEADLVGPAGLKPAGEWVNTTKYVFNDAVRHRGSTWRALRTNTGVEPNQANTLDWFLSAAGLFQAGNWTSGTNYRFNDVVRYNGGSYVANSDVNNSTTPPNTSTSFALLSRGMNHRGVWSSAAAYAVDDVVVHRNSSFRCSVTNTNSIPHQSAANWELLSGGYFPAGAWVSGTVYVVRDVVTYRGSRYVVIANHTSSGTPDVTPANYMLEVQKGDRGLTPRGQWAANVAYNVDDLVLNLGTQFRVTVAHTSVTAPTLATPGAEFEVFVAKGDTGSTGPPGIINQLQDEGINVPQRGVVNVRGTNVRVTDDGVKTLLDVTAGTPEEVGAAHVFSPFINIMPDSGRYSGKINPLTLTFTSVFANSTFFGLSNSSTVAEVGKFIHNNTTNGGTAGSLTQTVSDLLAAMGRTGSLARFGAEFFVAGYTMGTGTSTPFTFPDGIVRYLMTNNNTKVMFGFDSMNTFTCWVRAATGSLGITAVDRVWKNGVSITPTNVINAAEGWVHLRIQKQNQLGYDNAYPFFYSNSGHVIHIACPGFFPGLANAGMHKNPLATINELVA